MKTNTLSDEFYAATEKIIAQRRETIESMDEKRKSMEQFHYRLFKEPLPVLSEKKLKSVNRKSVIARTLS